MKICPRCQKTYVDDNLNFCLEDGSVLAQVAAQSPQTVMMGEPRPTQPQPQMPSQPGPQPGWNTPQQYSMQPPRKSSKTWIWVVLILGVVVLVCGGGFVGLVLIGMQVENRADINRSAPPPQPPAANKAANASVTTTTTTSTSNRTDLDTVVRIYRQRNLKKALHELESFSNEPTLAAAVSRAGLAERWNEDRQRWVRYDHHALKAVQDLS